MRTLIRSLLVVTLVASGGVTQAALAPQGAQDAMDGRIQALVERELDRRDSFRMVKVSVAGGVVTLSGDVAHLYARNQALSIAGKVKDVKSVIDQLTIESGVSDVSVADGVGHQVRTYSRFSVFDDIAVSARDGVVLLTGAVTTPTKSKDLEDRVSRVTGVREVKNDITVLPSSPSDDRLRYILYNTIYGDALFEQYAALSNPPIHIIVDRGHVTLTGVAASQMERQKAEMAARSVFGVFSVTNRIYLEK